MADVPPDLDNASPEDLKELVQTLLERVNALERENAALRDEIARLKGKPPRPDVKPSGMADKAQSPGASKAKAKSKKPGRGSKRSRLTIDEDRHLQDDAGQFRVGNHALCWVHAERLVNGLDTFNAAQRRAVDWVRRLIWWFYADLKLYAEAPTAERKAQLKRRFDRVFHRRTRLGSVSV